MKKVASLLIALNLCLASLNLLAQSLERSVVGSAGLSVLSENLQLSFTVGEVVAGRFISVGIQLSQGFQHAQITEVPTGITLPAYVREISAFPNPVGTTLYLDITASETFEFSVEVYSLLGEQQVLVTELQSIYGQVWHSVDLIGLAPGTYLLLISTNDGQPIKTFKIQKM